VKDLQTVKYELQRMEQEKKAKLLPKIREVIALHIYCCTYEACERHGKDRIKALENVECSWYEEKVKEYIEFVEWVALEMKEIGRQMLDLEKHFTKAQIEAIGIESLDEALN